MGFFTKTFAQEINVLPPPLNSAEYRTLAPHINYDGSKIVFIKESDKLSELVECIKNLDGSWSGPFKIDAVNNFDSVKFTIDAPAYNQNATEIYFSLKYLTKNANANIYHTKKINGEWSKPERLPSPVNSPEDETDPFLSPDGNLLFFAKKINNPELKKFDCFQLYVSEKKDGVWQKPIALPEPVNSGCDRMPRIAPDGKTLYFSSARDNNSDVFKLYYAKKITKNAWTSPLLIDTAVNQNEEQFPAVSAVGKELFFQFTDSKNKKQTRQYVTSPLDYKFQPEKTVRVNGLVSDLKNDNPLHAQISIIDPNTSIALFKTETDEKTGEYSFFIQSGRKYLIDVYKDKYSHYFFTYDAFRLSEFVDFKKNIKLYPEIDLIVNVFDNEIFEPLKSEIVVYDFETKEKVNVDIKETGTGRFSLILPLGLHYIVEAEKKHYEKGQFDLDLSGVVQFSEFERDMELQIKKIDYEIQLSDVETGEGVEALVEIINLTTNEKIVKQVKTDKDGKLNIKLRDGTRYEINVTPQGYSFYNTTVDLIDENAVYSKEVKLIPLREETKIELNDIHFETNSADLNKSSFEELDRVVKLMITNPDMKIEISAHTDDVGADIYNLKLSDKRAESVKEYLFSKEITSDRIVSKGYGESKPAFLPADVDENRAKNRRVELKVLQI